MTLEFLRKLSTDTLKIIHQNLGWEIRQRYQEIGASVQQEAVENYRLMADIAEILGARGDLPA